MKRKNATCSALFTSIMSLLLCVSMLVGTTFAWFTDEVKSGTNVIAAGNLDVELEYAVLNEDGTVKEWKTVNGATNLFTGNLWEPGHTEVVYLKLSNLGTLALKYNLGINIASEKGGINVDGNPFKLSDHIYMGVVENAAPTFVSREKAIEEAQKGANGIIGNGYSKAGSMTAGAKELYMAVVVYMPTTVGNEANYKTGTNRPEINLGINLFATQLEAESDSFGPDYDKDAVWTGIADTTWYNDTDSEFVLTSAEDLAGLAQLVNGGNKFNGKTVKLGADINLNNVNWTPIGVGSNKFEGTFIGTGYTISNLWAVGEKAVGLFGKTFTGAHIEGVTINTAYVSGNDYVGAILGQGYLGHNCIVNCTVTNATIIATPYFDNAKGVYDGGAKAGVIAGQAYNGNITGCTVTNSTVTAYRDLGAIVGMHDFDGKAGSTVVASGNTVKSVTLSYVGVAGKYDENTPNQNMGAIVGRVGAKASVAEDNTATDVTMNEANKGATMIFTLEELIAFAKEVNAGNTYAGKTVILGADIDLANMEWTPIGTSSAPFNGIFDGNGHTVSNLKINMAGKSDVGFFGRTNNGEIKNLTVQNATVTGRLNVGVVAGTPYTSKYTNITVKGYVEVNGMSYVGGVGGKNAYANWTDITVDVDADSYVKANSVENGTAYRTYVGGVIGFMGEGTHKVTNVTSNIDVVGTTCDVGGIVGIAHEGNSFENITCTGNVTITNAAEAGDAEEMGGIAGVWMNEGRDVTFIDCEFTGTLSANITEGVDLTDNTIVGTGYYATGEDNLVIENHYVQDGIEYVKFGLKGEDVTLYRVPADYEGTTVTVPEGVTAIGNYAFAYNSNVKEVVLASTVRDLGRGFDGSSVEKVVLNEGLEVISSRAFRLTTALKEVVISSTVKEIADNAFQKSGIKEIVIPANVETVGETAFGASLIEKVTFEGDIAIQGYAFRGCTKLRTVYMNGYDVTFVKSTLNGRNSMWFCNGESNNPNTSDITFYVKNGVIKERVLTAMGAERNNTTVNCEAEAPGEGGYYLDDQGNALAYNFENLAAALAQGGKIVLADDLKLDDQPLTIKAGKAVTLDLNGKTISGVSTSSTTSNLIKVEKGAELTLTGDGIISFGATTPDTNWGGEGQPAFPGYANNTISNVGKLVIDGVTIKNVTAPGGASYAIDCYQGSELTVKSGVIDGCGKVAIRMFCNSNTEATKVTIDGGVITGKRAIWVQLPGSNIANVRPVELTINGGQLISTDVSGDFLCIYSYSYGDSFENTKVTINGGEFTGWVDFGGGSAKTTNEIVTITGGTFNNGVRRWVTTETWVAIPVPTV